MQRYWNRNSFNDKIAFSSMCLLITLTMHTPTRLVEEIYLPSQIPSPHSTIPPVVHPPLSRLFRKRHPWSSPHNIVASLMYECFRQPVKQLKKKRPTTHDRTDNTSPDVAAINRTHARFVSMSLACLCLIVLFLNTSHDIDKYCLISGQSLQSNTKRRCLIAS